MIEKNVSSSVISKRMTELFNMRVDNDKEILEGITELSNFLQYNTPDSRRNLRSLIEGRTIQINDLENMNSSLQSMKTSLAETKKKTNSLIEKTLSIQKENKAVTLKKDIALAVINKFQLSPSEISLLKCSEITSDVFTILDKADKIIKECKVLLQTEDSDLAQNILEQTLLFEDNGMERLFKWIRAKCGSLETSVFNSILPQAMAKLQKKDNLIEQILEEISANRSIVLVRQFIDALTLGGHPIEHRVTEPTRYVSDMLAWLHQALPAEIDYLTFLLKNCDNADKYIQATLSKITEGICHPLRVRVEHVLLEEENSQNCILLQDIYNLLRDYNQILSQVIHDSRLNTTFMELSEVAEKTLLLSLQNKVSAILTLEREAVTVNHFPADSTEKIMSLLINLLSKNSTTQINEKYMIQVVSCVIDPLMNQITENALKLPAVEMAVYLLNSFHYVESSLALFPFLDERLERLKAQCDAQIDSLTSEQASALVAHLNLGPIFTVLQGNPIKPLYKLPAMDPSKILIVSGKIEKFLSAPNLYQLPQLAILSSATHKVTIQKRSLAVVLSIYSSLHQAVYDPENKYENPKNILPLSPEAVSTALKLSTDENPKA